VSRFALPDAGSFDDFCAREREYTSTLTVASPEVRAWIDFAENNNGSLPDFPLPLGNPEESSCSEMASELLMDAETDGALRISLHDGRRTLRRWLVRLPRPGRP